MSDRRTPRQTDSTVPEAFYFTERTQNARWTHAKRNVHALWTVNGNFSIHSECFSYLPYVVYFITKVEILYYFAATAMTINQNKHNLCLYIFFFYLCIIVYIVVYIDASKSIKKKNSRYSTCTYSLVKSNRNRKCAFYFSLQKNKRKKIGWLISNPSNKKNPFALMLSTPLSFYNLAEYSEGAITADI